MRSVTSCFNSTLYRKVMTRFWPLWALYGLIWLFAIPLNMLNEYFSDLRWFAVSDAQRDLLDLARGIPDFLTMGVSLSAVFGVLCAMAVFGYLYNNRSACMMHALPLRREALFVTSYLAGLSILLLPHLAVALTTAAAELALLPPAGWGQALPALGVWLLAQSGIALFFFSFAAFCAMFTGHILALPAFYGILNCLVVVVYSLVTELLAQFFYGFVNDVFYAEPLVEYCTPVYALVMACHSSTTYQWVADGVELSEPIVTYTGLDSPATVAAYAAAGLVFAVLALMVYRCRHVESAGDVVSVPLVRPLFKYGVAFCSGLCLGILTYAFFGWTETTLALSLSAVFWAVVGYFVAEMLLKKSFRVLRAWKGALAMALVMGALCLVCFLDLFGVTVKVPDAADVASLSVNGSFGHPDDSGASFSLDVTDPDQLQKFIDLHRAVVAEKDRSSYDSSSYEPGDDYLSFSFSYTLKNGSILQRRYYSVPVYAGETGLEGSVTWAANRLLQDRDLVEDVYDLDSYEEDRLVEAWLSNVYNQSSGYVGTLYLDGSAQALWEAVRQDFDAGTIGVRYLFNDSERQENTYVTDLCFSWEQTDLDGTVYTQGLTITLTPGAGHTLAVLESMGALETAEDGHPLVTSSASGRYYLQTAFELDGAYHEVTPGELPD